MYLYMIGAHSSSGAMRHFKVGITGDIKRRVRELQTGNNLGLHLIFAWKCKDEDDARNNENRVHWDCRSLRARGEWFYHHAFSKVLGHVVRQLGEPCLRGSSATPYGAEYTYSQCIETAMKNPRNQVVKKPMTPGSDIASRRARRIKKLDPFVAKSGPCVTIYP